MDCPSEVTTTQVSRFFDALSLDTQISHIGAANIVAINAIMASYGAYGTYGLWLMARPM